MTPREFAAVVDGFIWQQEQEAESQITVAWFTARLMRSKRFPTLKSLLEPDNKAKKLSPAEQAERDREFEELTAGNRVVVRGKR